MIRDKGYFYNNILIVCSIILIFLKSFLPFTNKISGDWLLRSFIISIIILTQRKEDLYEIIKKYFFELLMLFLWIIFLSINYIINRNYSYTQMNITLFLSGISYYFVGLLNNKYKQNIFILNIVFFILIIVSMVININLSAQNSYMVRFFSTDAMEYNELYKAGGSGYSFYTAVLLIAPYLFAIAYKQNKFVLKFVLISILSVVLVCFALLSTLSGIIFLLIMNVVIICIYFLLFMKKKIYKNTRFLVSVISIILIFLLIGITFKLLVRRYDFISLYISKINTSVYMIYTVNYLNEPTQRIFLTTKSIKVFLSHPFVGISHKLSGLFPTEIGGHSTWTDYLALYGVIYCFPIFTFIGKTIKNYIMLFKLSKDFTYYALISVLILYLIYGIFNVVTQNFIIYYIFFIIGLNDIHPKK